MRLLQRVRVKNGTLKGQTGFDVSVDESEFREVELDNGSVLLIKRDELEEI